MALARNQKAFIDASIRDAMSRHRSAIYALRDRPEPPEVAAARRIVERHDKLTEAYADKLRKRLDAEATKANRAALFGEPAEALAALDRFAKYNPVGT